MTRSSSLRFQSIIRHASSSTPTPDKDAPSFDAEISRIYKIKAENHRHPSGPWTTMLDQIHFLQHDVNATFKVLDLATGPGEPAETIARTFPNSTVVATDISPDQIALAQQAAAKLPHMTAQVANMEHLEFEDHTFDIVTCCYGFMFPPDIPKAIQEAHRVLKPGGHLIATTWNRSVMIEKPQRMMTQIYADLGKPPEPPAFDPLSLSKPGLFEAMLVNAGFEKSNLQIMTHEYPFDLTKDPELHFKSVMLSVKAKLDELDAWDKAREAFEEGKQSTEGAYMDNGHWMLTGNEYKLVVAKK